MDKGPSPEEQTVSSGTSHGELMSHGWRLLNSSRNISDRIRTMSDCPSRYDKGHDPAICSWCHPID